jgi:hypothetical protein
LQKAIATAIDKVSVSDPDSVRSVDPDPGAKMTNKNRRLLL